MMVHISRIRYLSLGDYLSNVGARWNAGGVPPYQLPWSENVVLYPFLLHHTGTSIELDNHTRCLQQQPKPKRAECGSPLYCE
jgi:hypothetical protein